jgi:predicted PhzF superfamily epimerase YddE/YHI9
MQQASPLLIDRKEIAKKPIGNTLDRKCYTIPVYTGCPNRYRTRHFFNNSNTNEDIATKFEQGTFVV